MAILLCAIGEADLQSETLEKLAGLKLSILSCPSLTAITVSQFGDLPTNTEAVLQYSQLIEKIRQITDIIPMRYGAVFADQSAICTALQPRIAHYQSVLTEIKHCVEMSVRVLIPPQASLPTQTMTGTDYLKFRQQQTNQHRQYTQQICQLLIGNYLKHKAEFSVEKSLLSLYFLVPISQLNKFQEKIGQFQPQKILVSGPWAAYNFVN
jgi:hypothetical protein